MAEYDESVKYYIPEVTLASTTTTQMRLRGDVLRRGYAALRTESAHRDGCEATVNSACAVRRLAQLEKGSMSCLVSSRVSKQQRRQRCWLQMRLQAPETARQRGCKQSRRPDGGKHRTHDSAARGCSRAQAAAAAAAALGVAGHTQAGRAARDADGSGARSKGSAGRGAVERGVGWGVRDADKQTRARVTHAQPQGCPTKHIEGCKGSSRGMRQTRGARHQSMCHGSGRSWESQSRGGGAR